MKTAIYVEDGIVQLVVTPETEFEKNALTIFQEKPLEATIFAGSFYDCRGGWARQSEIYPHISGSQNRQDHSLILRIKKVDVEK